MAFLQTAHRLSTLVPLSTCTRCCCNALVGDERLPTYCKARQFDSVRVGSSVGAGSVEGLAS